LPISVVITGMQNQANLTQAITAASTFKPLDQQQVAAILAKTKDAAMSGEYELFKTSARFDGTAKNSAWLA
jgi:hypothetical protein